MRVLVAGATGYLGGYVAREFKARGCFVRVLTRDRGRLGDLAGLVDEVFEGEITKPETLTGVCDGADYVFSSVGITRQKDGLSFWDVDYHGNRHLLDEAQRAGVRKFVYVSVMNGPKLRHMAIVDAHEQFVEDLAASGLDYAVVRPTGYFSDMRDFFEMAGHGRVYLFGDGMHSMNPIHGADLAKVCADAVAGDQTEVPAGGPDVLTYRDIARLALEARGMAIKIISVPEWVARLLPKIVKVFHKRSGQTLEFLTTMLVSDTIAPTHGTHTLRAHFQALADQAQAKP
ncbi:MAG: SDR family oxidoreductase [Deltaproteobacteria bacterium]|nr:SDR family oxidoreductase [Deltaproteobacteria bacterium]